MLHSDTGLETISKRLSFTPTHTSSTIPILEAVLPPRICVLAQDVRDASQSSDTGITRREKCKPDTAYVEVRCRMVVLAVRVWEFTSMCTVGLSF